MEKLKDRSNWGIKDLLDEAKSTTDWDEIKKDLENGTGEKFPHLTGKTDSFHFSTWEELEFILLAIAGKAYISGAECIVKDNPLLKTLDEWCNEFIKEIKP